jgi:hypothetical protein
MTVSGRNRTCAAAARGNLAAIIPLAAIAHNVKLKTGAVICLGKSALTTSYLFSFGFLH